MKLEGIWMVVQHLVESIPTLGWECGKVAYNGLLINRLVDQSLKGHLASFSCQGRETVDVFQKDELKRKAKLRSWKTPINPFSMALSQPQLIVGIRRLWMSWPGKATDILGEVSRKERLSKRLPDHRHNRPVGRPAQPALMTGMG